MSLGRSVPRWDFWDLGGGFGVGGEGEVVDDGRWGFDGGFCRLGLAFPQERCLSLSSFL